MIKEVRFCEDANEIQHAVTRLKHMYATDHESAFEHRDVCQPINDRRVPHVYLCKYGQVHVCLPGTCELGVVTSQGEFVCPVSGLMLGCEESYTMKTEPHWRRVKEKIVTPTTKVLRFPTRKQIVEKTTIILEKLLFSKERARINHEYSTKAADACKRQLAKEEHAAVRSNQFR
jgi:hypothetical protein